LDRKRQILEFLGDRSSATGAELIGFLGISRQALHVHLRPLIESGRVVKIGSTRAARYALASRAPSPSIVTRDLRLDGLEEHHVYAEVAAILNLQRELPKNAGELVQYAFTEMLNNAIEHSEAKRCDVRFRLDTGTAYFEIRDRGIGIFHSIASKLGLDNEHAAMVELLKGRTTTMKERHTGEGVFFTSRTADRFTLRSHRIQIEWNRSRDDVFVSQQRRLEGTDVRFLVHRGTRRRLADTFAEFAPEEFDFRFLKTRVHVRLLQEDYVSRSEAKRLMLNLEKFREVVLDFRKVASVGQGFADEIFRVFATRYPETAISVENANQVVAAMIRHVS
jgi:anti-sigma regulatory factor (Ser/Thr protein kinase)